MDVLVALITPVPSHNVDEIRRVYLPCGPHATLTSRMRWLMEIKTCNFPMLERQHMKYWNPMTESI